MSIRSDLPASVEHDWEFYGAAFPGCFVLRCIRCGVECDPDAPDAAGLCSGESVDASARDDEPVAFHRATPSEFAEAWERAKEEGRQRLEALRKRHKETRS